MIIKLIYFLVFLLAGCALINCQQKENEDKKFRLGADVLIDEHLSLIKDKKIGLVINHTSRLSNKTHLLDTLLSLGVNVSVIFTPEHGIYGEFERGKLISDYEISTIPIYSLYGNVRKPYKEMLANLDIIVYDLQDLGVRFYTYISTLFYVLESATEKSIPMMILDRPNPNDGIHVAGPVLNNEFKSFIGLTEIPVIYGMTAGELAQLYLNEFILNSNSDYELTIIKMKGWNRNSSWENTGINWIPPSPNIPDVQTAIVYPGTCFLEGTNISEGRGTEHPFLQIGAPFVSSEELIYEMRIFTDKAYALHPISFLPGSIKGKAENPKYLNEVCNGLLITVLNSDKFNAVGFAVKLIYTLHKLYPEQFKFEDDYFDKLAGTDQLRKYILQNKSPEFIINTWKEELSNFKIIRNNYLLY